MLFRATSLRCFARVPGPPFGFLSRLRRLTDVGLIRSDRGHDLTSRPRGCPVFPEPVRGRPGRFWTGWGGGRRRGLLTARQDHPPSISRVFAKTSARCWSVPGSLAIKPTITASSSGRRGTSVQRPVQRLCGLAVSALPLALRTTGLLIVILGVAGSSPVSHPFFRSVTRRASIRLTCRHRPGRACSTFSR
jgi:hypothetical protein